MDEMKRAIAVMFSGGTDSTFAAWSQIPHYDRIHLLTFYRHGLRKSQNTREAVDRLKGAFPYKDIRYHEVDFEDIYQMITPKKQKLTEINPCKSFELCNTCYAGKYPDFVFEK